MMASLAELGAVRTIRLAASNAVLAERGALTALFGALSGVLLVIGLVISGQ